MQNAKWISHHTENLNKYIVIITHTNIIIVIKTFAVIENVLERIDILEGKC